ncbi:MerR family transcriptional regulator [Nocardia sp. NBC_01009]|uniref:MerR family transcriptional regulator n=1 Tax=Nocardia sp. NBC_01009 TaxID=2975996 RepID=UPI0038630109|nr:MerR family transcriptional regulator [Nocardia sp. NBC_01009]
MLIGELSRRTGVGTHLLRYYESQGLLEPGRGANGYREFTEDAILTVTQIRGLLEAGLSTEDIGLLLPCATGAGPDIAPCTELLDVLRACLRGLDERIDALTQNRQALRSYLDAAERAPAIVCDPTR